VTLAYACAEADAGATVRVRVGKSSAEARVVAAPAPRIPLPHRDEAKDNYVDRVWGTLRVGQLQLTPGRNTLVVEAVSKPGQQVLELKHVELRRLNGATSD
jgi:hypothetical protein